MSRDGLRLAPPATLSRTRFDADAERNAQPVASAAIFMLPMTDVSVADNRDDLGKVNVDGGS